MNDRIEESGFEHYLRGNSELSRAYRELGDSEPPAQVDAAVRRAARAGAGTNRRLGWRLVPLAAAAVVALSFGLVLRFTATQHEPPAGADTSRVEQGFADSAAQSLPRLPADAGREKARALDAAAIAKTAAEAPGTACPRPREAAPQTRLDFVICLRNAGAEDIARHELASFRSDYPDFPLPEPLQDL